jgi:hypothetical protein
MDEAYMAERVSHPAHYTFGKYEVIDVLEDWFGSDPLLWQVGKYLARAGRKCDTLEDLLKAQWYLKRRIDNLLRETGRTPVERTQVEREKFVCPECDIRS